VIGLRPERPVRGNARRILRTRLDELYAFDRAVADPDATEELHDMRIAAKRLRYLCEVFAPVFDGALDGFVDDLRDLQELLGDIHDCDVQLPLAERELAAAALAGRRRARERAGLRAWAADLERRREARLSALRTCWPALRERWTAERFAEALRGRRPSQ
jgi:CHAD domain-containing protein